MHTLTSVDRIDQALAAVRTARMDARDDALRAYHAVTLDRLLDVRQAMVNQTAS